MALRHEPAQDPAAPDPSRRRSSKKESAFRTHLTVYLCVGLFLFTLNLLTSHTDLWFYWPMFFWGWGLVFQAVATYGAEAPARTIDALRSIVPGLSNALPARSPAPTRSAPGAPFAATAFATVHDRIQHLKEIVWAIPDGPVRDQAIRICEGAERIVAAMAADRVDAETVEWFNTQLLAPAESLLERYSRLAGRGVSGADDALRKVEEESLPLLQSRFDALYDTLHRGELVDLAVASEMLDLEPPAPPRAPLRNPR